LNLAAIKGKIAPINVAVITCKPSAIAIALAIPGK